MAGCNVELKFNITAKPAPTIEWFKDGRELEPNAPLIDGGSPVTNYIVEKKASIMKAYQVITTECANTSYKVSDLEEDKAYFFRVSAENEYGVGDPCETTEPVRATETPGAVKDLVMVDSTKNSVTLQWIRPEHDGGSHITEYIVEKRPREDPAWTLGATCKRCNCEVTGLKENTLMYFRVFAKNEKGKSDFSQIGPITVMDFIIPPESSLTDYPDGELAVCIGQNIHIELPFKGKPRPEISWLKDNFPLKESEKVHFRTSDNKTAVTVRGAKKEDAGQYTLVLDNRLVKNYFDINVITVGPPSAPVGPIRFDEIKAQSIIISWDTPKEDGGGEITCYSVEKRETSLANWKMVCSSVVKTTFKIPNLVMGNEYQFRVRAENKYGVSEPLNSSDIVAHSKCYQVLTLRAGENVKLSCSITGRPIPQVVWYKDGKEIDKRTMIDIEITTGIGTSSVFIRDADRSHRGIYSVEAKNSSGTKKAEVNVRVQGW
uniref:Titin n=1 Tax=Monopterus albus TaxID=43700 RepID=A0A3Q3JDW0_MONAL